METNMNIIFDTSTPSITTERWHIISNFINKCDSVRVRFIAKDGIERNMLCTTSPLHMPKDAYTQLQQHTLQRTSFKTLSVWALDKDDWRSFNVDTVLSVTCGTE